MTDKKSFYHKDNIAVYKAAFPKSLVYPDDLDADNFYPDCVCFTIQKRTGVSIDDVTKATGEAYKTYMGLWNANEGVPPGMKKEVEDALKKNAGNKSSQLTEQEVMQAATVKWKKDNPKVKLPENMKDLIIASATTFAAEHQKAVGKALERGTDGTNIIGSIYLNMPNAIQFNEAANWSGDSLGFMGNMAKEFVGGTGAAGEMTQTAMGAVAGSAGNILGGAIGALPSLVSKLGISGGMFGAAIGAMAAGSPMQKGAEAALGVAQNPYMEMMFSGVGFRKFQFEFVLRPKSSAEVKTVANMLRMFRTFTKPSYVEGKLGKSFMDYPMEFQIKFLTSSGDGVSNAFNKTSFSQNKNIPQLKNCVCDNVTSNFTPQSIWAAHSGGAPVAVTLGLSFQETELVMAEDVYDKDY